MASKVKTIVLLRAPYFGEAQRKALEKWLNAAMTYDRYSVQVVDFIDSDPDIIKSHELGEVHV